MKTLFAIALVACGLVSSQQATAGPRQLVPFESMKYGEGAWITCDIIGGVAPYKVKDLWVPIDEITDSRFYLPDDWEWLRITDSNGDECFFFDDETNTAPIPESIVFEFTTGLQVPEPKTGGMLWCCVASLFVLWRMTKIPRIPNGS